jgi:hypothetical protein
MESPLGTLTLVNTNGVLTGLYMPDHLRGPKADLLGSRATSGFDVARSQLSEYFERKRIHFDLSIVLYGTTLSLQSHLRVGHPFVPGCRSGKSDARPFNEANRLGDQIRRRRTLPWEINLADRAPAGAHHP